MNQPLDKVGDEQHPGEHQYQRQRKRQALQIPEEQGNPQLSVKRDGEDTPELMSQATLHTLTVTHNLPLQKRQTTVS